MPILLEPDDFVRAAARLGCSVRAIRALDHVESRGQGFLASGEPTILYEPHVFHRGSGGRFDGEVVHIGGAAWPLSYRRWKRGAYGPTGIQHTKLAAAVRLDREAALKACSWGRYQILGENHRRCGFTTVQAFVTAMYGSEQAHLSAFCAFIESDPKLHAALRTLDWRTVALRYNGSANVPTYSRLLAKAYNRFGE
ncbi:MAG: N-acetylmuramidase family protein [Rhodothermales bacterium]|nr:N-acetylmuramidase family protein [Rhodothermales bacterium]